MSASAESSSAFSIIQQRYEKNSVPGQRTDDYGITALFEPGAMRSIIVASEAATVGFLKRRNTFDRFSGSSSGGMIGMCVATEQSEEMVRTFLYRVPSPEFVNLRRVLRGNIVNINFLVRGILMQSPELDWQRVRDSDIPINVIAKSAVTGQSVIFDSFRSEEDVFGALSAAAWMPKIAGWKPYIHNGHPYWDLMSNGLEEVITDGCTHVVIFRSDHKKQKYSRAVLGSDVIIEEIKPTKTIGRLEKRQKVLKNAVRMGALAVLEAFQPTESEIDVVREHYELLGVSL